MGCKCKQNRSNLADSLVERVQAETAFERARVRLKLAEAAYARACHQQMDRDLESLCE